MKALFERLLRWPGWRTHWPALIGLALLTALISYPLPLHVFRSAYVGGRNVDVWMKLWDSWWLEQVLLAGQRPYFTPYFFHPLGADLRFHSISWTTALAWLPLAPIFGDIGAYNLVTLLITLACAASGYLLGWRLTGSRTQAWLAGVIFAFTPLRNGYSGPWPDLSNAQWIALAGLAAWLAAERRQARDAVWGAVVVALAAWTSLYIMVVLALTVCLLVAALALQGGRWRDPAFRRTMALLAALSALLLVPRLVPIFRDTAALGGALQLAGGAMDALAPLTPSRYHGVYYRLLPFLRDSKPQSFFVGIVPLALAITALAARRTRRQAAPWAITGGVFLLLALGPVLTVGGVEYPAVPMPARLAQLLPFIRGVDPQILSLGMALPLAALAALGAGVWLARWRERPARQSAALALATAAILFDAWSGRFALQDTRPSPFYAQIAAEPGEFAIIDLPMGRQLSKRYMYYQTIHGRPIIEGTPGRAMPGTYAYFDGNPLLYRWVREKPLNCRRVDYAANLQALADDGFRYIIVHRDPDDGHIWEFLPSYFTVEPVYQDDQLLAYRIDAMVEGPSPCAGAADDGG